MWLAVPSAVMVKICWRSACMDDPVPVLAANPVVAGLGAQLGARLPVDVGSVLRYPDRCALRRLLAALADTRRTRGQEDVMLAIAAAVLFGLALLFELAGLGFGPVFTVGTLTTAGLLCVALHLAGVATDRKVLRRRRRR